MRWFLEVDLRGVSQRCFSEVQETAEAIYMN